MRHHPVPPDARRRSTAASAGASSSSLRQPGCRPVHGDRGDLAQDTTGLLDHLGVASAHLVAMSMGDMIARAKDKAIAPQGAARQTDTFGKSGDRTAELRDVTTPTPSSTATVTSWSRPEAGGPRPGPSSAPAMSSSPHDRTWRWSIPHARSAPPVSCAEHDKNIRIHLSGHLAFPARMHGPRMTRGAPLTCPKSDLAVQGQVQPVG
jgi:pimeloyl-ACP methyl ester carboxylesterase